MKPARRLSVVTVALCTLMWIVVAGFSGRYLIAFDGRASRCLPWHVYLVDRTRRDPRKFHLMAFRAASVPHIADDTLILKFVAGTPGDAIRSAPKAVRAAGINWGPINPAIAHVLDTTPDALAAQGLVPGGFVEMLTGAADGYDSRYWGLVAMDQLVGEAVPLW